MKPEAEKVRCISASPFLVTIGSLKRKPHDDFRLCNESYTCLTSPARKRNLPLYFTHLKAFGEFLSRERKKKKLQQEKKILTLHLICYHVDPEATSGVIHLPPSLSLGSLHHSKHRRLRGTKGKTEARMRGGEDENPKRKTG